MRATCSVCNFLILHCLCSAIKKTDLPFKLIIFRDAIETKHAFNTVKILRACINNAEIIDLTKDIATNRFLVSTALKKCELPLLLFPTPSAREVDFHKEIASSKFKIELDTLVLIDGTWDKSKKIFFEHPELSQLSAIMLKNLPDSEYTIRKSNFKGGVSSLESVFYFLSILGNKEEALKIWAPFDLFVKIQKQFLKN